VLSRLSIIQSNHKFLSAAYIYTFTHAYYIHIYPIYIYISSAKDVVIPYKMYIVCSPFQFITLITLALLILMCIPWFLNAASSILYYNSKKVENTSLRIQDHSVEILYIVWTNDFSGLWPRPNYTWPTGHYNRNRPRDILQSIDYCLIFISFVE